MRGRSARAGPGSGASGCRRVRPCEHAALARELGTEPFTREAYVAPRLRGARTVSIIRSVPVVAQRLELVAGRIEEARTEGGTAGKVRSQPIERRVVTDLPVGRVGRARIE